MKAIHLATTIIAVFLLLYTNGIQAQDTVTQINQVELMKQLLGTWESQMSQDTFWTGECKTVWNGLEWSSKTITKGKIIKEAKSLIGYDKKNDKLIESEINNINPNIRLYSIWFTSTNKFVAILFEDICNPEKTAFSNYEFKSSDLLIETNIKNNKTIGTHTYHRVNK